jgi:hypothetical protein
MYVVVSMCECIGALVSFLIILAETRALLEDVFTSSEKHMVLSFSAEYDTLEAAQHNQHITANSHVAASIGM